MHVCKVSTSYSPEAVHLTDVACRCLVATSINLVNPVSRQKRMQKRRHRLSTVRSEVAAVLNGVYAANRVQTSSSCMDQTHSRQAESFQYAASSQSVHGLTVLPSTDTSKPEDSEILDANTPSTSYPSSCPLSQQEATASFASTVDSVRVPIPFHHLQDLIAMQRLREVISEKSHGSALPLHSIVQAPSMNESPIIMNTVPIVPTSDASHASSHIATFGPDPSRPGNEEPLTHMTAVASRARNVASTVPLFENFDLAKDGSGGAPDHPDSQPPESAQREQRSRKVTPMVGIAKELSSAPRDSVTRSRSRARASIPPSQSSHNRPQSPTLADGARNTHLTTHVYGINERQGHSTQRDSHEQGGDRAEEGLSKNNMQRSTETVHQDPNFCPACSSAPPDSLLRSRFAHDIHTCNHLQRSYSDNSVDAGSRTDAASQLRPYVYHGSPNLVQAILAEEYVYISSAEP